MLVRQIYAKETASGYKLSAYINYEGKDYIDHEYEGEKSFDDLVEEFISDNPEYKDVAISWE